ncbi:hypothetical protein [Rosistilla carotiformis]|uniref:hypothetical protein n=1 Tax=Rosistilla carotiformis TaxID=2528017 RepID=UPI0018D223C0|nr:hypothetical protein [Rosistilla carotiformis]
MGIWVLGIWVLGIWVLGIWVLGIWVLGIWVLGIWVLGIWVLAGEGSLRCVLFWLLLLRRNLRSVCPIAVGEFMDSSCLQFLLASWRGRIYLNGETERSTWGL